MAISFKFFHIRQMKKVIKVDDKIKFQIWYKDSIENLKKLPNGNGAIAALMVTFPLYESCYDYELKINKIRDNRPLWVKADLNLQTEKEAQIFWNVFRDGLSHSATFFEVSDKSPKLGTLPNVRLSGKYTHAPQFVQDKNEFVIQLNPWSFCDHVLTKYQKNSNLLSYDPNAPLLALHWIIDDTG